MKAYPSLTSVYNVSLPSKHVKNQSDDSIISRKKVIASIRAIEPKIIKWVIIK